MSRDVIVRLKFFRSILITVFLANGAALFFDRPFASFLVAFLSLVWIIWCIRCATCGKSPFIRWVGRARVGVPVPEIKCSRCGREFRQSDRMERY
jgi:hypothetical protein